MEIISRAWFLRNVDQLCDGEGLTCFMYLVTVASLTRKPSFSRVSLADSTRMGFSGGTAGLALHSYVVSVSSDGTAEYVGLTRPGSSSSAEFGDPITIESGSYNSASAGLDFTNSPSGGTEIAGVTAGNAAEQRAEALGEVRGMDGTGYTPWSQNCHMATSTMVAAMGYSMMGADSFQGAGLAPSLGNPYTR